MAYNNDNIDDVVRNKADALVDMLNDVERSSDNDYLNKNEPNQIQYLKTISYADDAQKLNTSMQEYSNRDKTSYETDKLENTLDISSEEIEQLKKVRNILNQLNTSNSNQIQTNQGSRNENGKVLVKALPGANTYENYSEEPTSKDNAVFEIVVSFFACLQLALVTAGIGVGWLLYLVYHLM